MPMGKKYKAYDSRKRMLKKKAKTQKGYAMTKRIPMNIVSVKADYTSFFRCNPQEIANGSTLPLIDGIVIKLSDIINFSSYTTLWDQYRIDQVIIKFIPVQSEAVFRPYDDTTNPGFSVSEIPRLTTVIDRDDSTVANTFNEIFQRPQSRTRKATKPIVYKFVPNRLIEVYRSSLTTGYRVDNESKSYLDCGYSDVPHYGIKFALEATSPANAYQYRIERTYKISFKNRRL